MIEGELFSIFRIRSSRIAPSLHITAQIAPPQTSVLSASLKAREHEGFNISQPNKKEDITD
jgi:hypothetical protein